MQAQGGGNRLHSELSCPDFTRELCSRRSPMDRATMSIAIGKAFIRFPLAVSLVINDVIVSPVSESMTLAVTLAVPVAGLLGSGRSGNGKGGAGGAAEAPLRVITKPFRTSLS